MRAIAEEAFAIVKEYEGSHSGEHGDGLVRSEFHEAMFGGRWLVPRLRGGQGRLRPGGACSTPARSSARPKMDDRSLLPLHSRITGRVPIANALDWSAMGRVCGRDRDVQQQRRLPGARPRRHVPVVPRHRRRTASDARSRQHASRLALSGQPRSRGAGLQATCARQWTCAFRARAAKARMPDRRRSMARMKIEFLHHYRRRHRLGARATG